LCWRSLYLTGFLLIALPLCAQQHFNPTGNGCANPYATLVSVTNTATSGTSAVQIVALSGTAKIYVCSLTVLETSGTTPTFSLESGTGTNCASSTTVLVFPFTGSTTTPTTFANPVAVTAAGFALCYIQTGTTPIYKFVMTYVQQ
jgi:hypothetical protein